MVLVEGRETGLRVARRVSWIPGAEGEENDRVLVEGWEAGGTKRMDMIVVSLWAGEWIEYMRLLSVMRSLRVFFEVGGGGERCDRELMKAARCLVVGVLLASGY